MWLSSNNKMQHAENHSKSKHWNKCHIACAKQEIKGDAEIFKCTEAKITQIESALLYKV